MTRRTAAVPGTRAPRAGRRSATFQSLGNRNYRLYFVGQLISMAGTFMQAVAQAWLVLGLTGSGTSLGVLTALQFTPMLVLGGPAGVLIDRMDRRRLYLWTEVIAGLEALLLGVLVVTGVVQLWMVYVMAVLLGVITAVDQPVRSTIVLDLVGPKDLANAVSLQMAMSNASRVAGPAIAGVTIAVLGIGPCFLLNAASYLAVIVALLMMRPDEMHPQALVRRSRGQFRAGIAYVRRTPELSSLLLLCAIMFGFAWEFDVVIPLLARFTFHAGAGLYGTAMSALGVGAVVGGLIVARLNDSSNRALLATATAFGVTLLMAGAAPSVATLLALMGLVGVAGVGLASICSTRLQLAAAPDMRGRVVALWSIAVVGTRPIGGPIAGYIGETFGPRIALGMGGVAVLVIALPIWFLFSRRTPSTARP